MKNLSYLEKLSRSAANSLLAAFALALLLASPSARARDVPEGLAPAPLVIGSTVFQDYNRDGNLNAGEPGLAGVPVRLFRNGIQRGQTVTDANGQFSFTNANVPQGVQPNTTYEVRIASADFPVGFTLTKLTTGASGNNAQFIGNNAVVSVTTDGSGNPVSAYGIGFAAGYPDLAITTGATTSTAVRGSTVTFTVSVSNNGSGPATSVVVSSTLDPGLTYVSSSPASTTTASANGTIVTFNLNTITAGAATTTLNIVTTAQREGVLYNTASVTTADIENNPSNNISRGCVSVPIKLCPSDSYVASLPAEYTNVQWFRNGGTTSIAAGNSLTIVQSGRYTFTTTANSSCPTGGCCPIIVEDGIVPNLAITPVNPAICRGTSTTLTATGCSGGTLVWNTGSSNASIIVSPIATTVYSITCNSTTYGTCTASISSTVTVNPSVTATLSSATICNGTVASLVATGGTSYVLTPGNIISSTGSFTVNPSVTTAYTVIATNANNCSAPASGTVTVNPSVTATLSSATICNGTVASLVATGGTSYVLSPGNIISSTGSFTVNPSVTTAYTVIATNANNCSAPASGTVTVNPSVTATLSSATICNGTVASLVATGGTSYVLSPGNIISSTGSFTVNPSVTTAYTVIATNANNCSAPASGTVTVTPTPSLTLNAPTIFAGQSVVLTPGGCSGTLTWNTGDQVSSLTVVPLMTTTYSATCVLTTGCSSSIAVTVVVNNPPTYDAVVATPPTCNGATPNSDGKISLTGLANAVQANVSTGNTYTGPAFNGAGNVPISGSTATISGLPNPAAKQTYTVRLFSAGGASFTDVTVILDPASCQCPAPSCVPIIISKIQR